MIKHIYLNRYYKCVWYRLTYTNRKKPFVYYGWKETSNERFLKSYYMCYLIVKYWNDCLCMLSKKYSVLILFCTKKLHILRGIKKIIFHI